jgi:hypothetical protein
MAHRTPSDPLDVEIGNGQKKTTGRKKMICALGSSATGDDANYSMRISMWSIGAIELEDRRASSTLRILAIH